MKLVIKTSLYYDARSERHQNLVQMLRMSQTTSQLPHMPSRLVEGQIWAYFVTHSVVSVREIIGDYPES
jgi:hypothetical protein